ncbi:MAG TPA: L,D-transpeptidase family protein [Streptosporangiaceae bacterium]|nr:L,D-transpeptidase family protein [Streptosporangiaceae bacterium]
MRHVMGNGAWRLLIGLGSAAAVGAAALSLAPGASASTAGIRQASTAQPAAKYKPTSKPIRFGMRGSAVKALQRRLNVLHYWAGKADGRFGWDTMEAVWAFKEVQSGKAIPKNHNVVTPFMQRQLLHPKLPKILIKKAHWTRIEVNKNIGVLVVYHGKKIALISHISSAAKCRPDRCGWSTPDGQYRAREYLAGAVPDSSFGGFMYNPVFFIGRSFAIHGMPNPTSTFSPDGVPLNAASHGCIRIPMDISKSLHRLVRISPTTGTWIYVRGDSQPDDGI